MRDLRSEVSLNLGQKAANRFIRDYFAVLAPEVLRFMVSTRREILRQLRLDRKGDRSDKTE